MCWTLQQALMLYQWIRQRGSLLSRSLHFTGETENKQDDFRQEEAPWRIHHDIRKRDWSGQASLQRNIWAGTYVTRNQGAMIKEVNIGRQDCRYQCAQERAWLWNIPETERQVCLELRWPEGNLIWGEIGEAKQSLNVLDSHHRNESGFFTLSEKDAKKVRGIL